MPILSIIGIIIQIIFKLPSIISVGAAIIKLLPKFKEGGWQNDLLVIGEILKLILGLIPADKLEAKTSMQELLDNMKNPKVAEGKNVGLEELKDKLKSKCEGVGCPSDLVAENAKRDKYRV